MKGSKMANLSLGLRERERGVPYVRQFTLTKGSFTYYVISEGEGGF